MRDLIVLRTRAPASGPGPAGPLSASAGRGFAPLSHASSAVLLAVVCLVLYLPGLTSLPPMDRDEPRFAQASKQMLETGDYVDIRFQDEARNKKPVGIYWLQAATVGLAERLGFTDARRTIWLYRLPSLLGAIVAVLATYWTALTLTTRRAALLAAVLFASTILLTVEAHLAKTDAVNTATVVLAMGALGRSYRETLGAPLSRGRVRNAAIFWTALGIGILVKGPITPLIVGLAVLAISILRRSWSWLMRLYPGRGVLWMLLLILPWFVLILMRTNGAFFADAVGTDMLGKVAGGQELHGAPPGSYLAALWLTGWPMTPFVALAMPLAWYRRREPAVAFLLCWIVPAWLLFEAVPTKLPHYVLPLYPGIAILAATVLAGETRWLPRRSTRVAVLTAILIGLMPVAMMVVMARGGGVLWSGLGSVTIALGGLAVIATLALAGLTARALAKGRVGLAVSGAGAAATVAYAFVLGHLLTPGVSDRLDLSARLARAGNQALGIGCQTRRFASAGNHEPSLVFLVGTDLRLTTPTDAATFIQGGPCRAAFITAPANASFRDALGDPAAAQVAQHVAGTLINGGKALDIAGLCRAGSATMTSVVQSMTRYADPVVLPQPRRAASVRSRFALRSVALAGLVLCAGSAAFLDRRAVALASGLPPRVQHIARALTDLGTSGYMLVIAALVVAFCIWRLRNVGLRRSARERLVVLRERAIVFFAVVALTGIGAQILKHVVGRARPRLSADLGPFHFDPFSIRASLASFPSGHATTAFAAATTLGLFLPRWRVPLLIVASLIALSRAVVGAHYVSDVVGGAAFGIAVAVLLARWFAIRRFALVLRDGWPEALPMGGFVVRDPSEAAGGLKAAS